SVVGGTLNVGVAGGIGTTSSVNVNGGTLAIGANSDTVAGVILTSGSITGGPGVLTSNTDFDMRSGNVTAPLGGSVGVVKSASGVVTFSGANTYTGLTTVSAGGVLKLANANALGNTSTGTVVEAGAALQINGTVN